MSANKAPASGGNWEVRPMKAREDWITILNRSQGVELRVMHYSSSVDEERWANFITDTLNKAEADDAAR